MKMAHMILTGDLKLLDVVLIIVPPPTRATADPIPDGHPHAHGKGDAKAYADTA